MSKSKEELSSELYQRGREAMEQHQNSEAAALFRSSISLRPHSKSLELLGECLLEMKSAPEEAIVFLAAAAGLGNKASRAFFLLARALSSQGMRQDAIEKLEIAIEMQPQFRAAIELRDALLKSQNG